MATINGTENGDNLIDVAGNDTITAGGGDDTITVTNGGTDTVDGGGGSDRLVLDARNLGGTVTMTAPTQNADGLSGSATWSGTSVSFQRIEHFTIFTHSSNVHDFVTTGGGDDVFHHAPQNFSTYLHDEITLGAGTDTLAADFTGITYGSVTIVIQSVGANGQNGVLVVGGNGKVVFNGVDRFAITGSNLADTVTAGSGNDSLNGGLGNDTLNGGDGNDTLDGGAGNDTMNGNGGDDTLITAVGQDTANGGTGTDTLVVEWSTRGGGGATIFAPPTADSAGGFSGEFRNSSGDRIAFTSMERLVFTGLDGGDAVIGLGNDDVISTRGGPDTITSAAGAGRDRIDAGAGTDTVSADWSDLGAGQDVVIDTTAVDGGSVTIGSGDDERYLRGVERLADFRTGAGNDTVVTDNLVSDNIISTGAGDDTITVSGGDDQAHGGTGTDTLVVDWSTRGGGGTTIFTAPTADSAGGFSGEFRNSSGDSIIFTSMERLVFTGLDGSDTVIGLGNDDVISTRGGDDTITSGAGAGRDRIDAGAGTDTVSADWSDLGVGENVVIDTRAVGGGSVTIGTGDSERYLRGVEVLASFSTGAGNDRVITGSGSFNDTISTGAGDDTIGVSRSNSFAGAGAGDKVHGGTGTDTLIIDFSYIGNFSASVATPAAGFDGAFSQGFDGSRVDYTSIERFEITTANGGDNITTGSGDDIINTAGGNDTINAGAGNDTLNGGTGADTMRGGSGNDIYIVDDGGDAVIENTDEGVDEVRTIALSYTLTANVENLTGTGAANQTLTGNDLDNLIDGGAGADTMTGGRGNDTYIVDDVNDQVVELGGEGTDEVRTALGSRTNFAQLYALAANVEKLTGTSTGDQGVRDNGLNNTVVMGVGNDLVAADQGGEDVVDGGAGDDFLYFGDKWSGGDQAIGGAGYDGLGLMGGGTYMFEAGDLSSIEQLALYAGPAGSGPFIYNVATADANVAAGERLFVNAFSLGSADTLVFDGSAELDGRFTLFGGAGTDSLSGGQKGDHIDGRAGDDILYGLGGNDVLIGGMGADTLIGGNGRDILLYSSAAESTGVTFDTIVGFDYRVDKVDLHSSVSGWTGDIQTGTLTTANFDSDLAAAVDDALLANSAVLYQPDEGDYVGRAFVVIDADGDGVYKQGVDYVFEIIEPVVPLVPTTQFFA
jgi:Ca2+-binding RTX toxin-like protein